MSFNFGDANFIGDLLKLLTTQGDTAWRETAQQLALTVARGDDGDPNPDPALRARLDALTPLVARHLETLLGEPVDAACRAVTRSDLALAALADWAPLLERSFTQSPPDLSSVLPEAMAPMMQQMASVLGPLFGGFQLGSAAGHFVQRAWSLGVLALPRTTRDARLQLANVASFAEEWSLDLDTALAFAAAFELAAAAVLARPSVADATGLLVLDALADARAQQGDLMEQLGTMMGGNGLDPSADPSTYLEQLHSPDATPATRALEAYTATLRELCLRLAAEVTTALLGNAAAPLEAVRRHFASDARGEEAAAALFGLTLRGELVTGARHFADVVRDLYGLDALLLVTRVDGAPSVADLGDATGWYERVARSPLA